MQLMNRHTLDCNVFRTVTTIASFGTSTLSDDDEKELLRDFPSKIAYKDLEFKGTVYISDKGKVVYTDKAANENNQLSVTLPPLANREIPIDEHFKAEYYVDFTKITDDTLTASKFKTKEQLAQAYCVIFEHTINEAVKSVMTKLRSKAPYFVGEQFVDV